MKRPSSVNRQLDRRRRELVGTTSSV